MSAAFVPGFDHDVFVSYAHVDNQPLLVPGGVPAGWVDTLVENLKRLLSQQLGRRDWGRLWFDPNLRGDEAFPPVLREAVSRAATLLVIFSEGYLQSNWCRRERETFLQAAAQQGNTQGRIFVVKLMDIERSRWPQEFRDLLGYEFFSKEREHAPVRTLRMLADDPGNQLYFRRLDDLSRELADRLQSLRERPAAPVQSPTATPTEPTVFLAEVTPDLEEWRDNLRSQLKQVGIQTLPTSYYDRSPAVFQAAMEKDLAASTLFVQVLGPYTTPRTQDLPSGYEGLQLDLAKAAGKMILRWHDPGLDRKTVRNPDLLACEPVMVMPFEDFKREVEQQTRLLASQRDLTPAAGEAFALINAKSPDMAVAQTICQMLEAHAIGYDLIDETENLVNLAQTCNYHALIVIYGQCEQLWVQKQVRDCRTIMLGKKAGVPVCAVYTGPPPGKEPLRIKPPRFHFFSDPHEPAFQQFIKAVQAQVAA
ncbi:MAG: toll/interleukin-1 receptor domain-containing protein [Candidatus Competibacteraceae bacterium]